MRDPYHNVNCSIFPSTYSEKAVMVFSMIQVHVRTSTLKWDDQDIPRVTSYLGIEFANNDFLE